jgi:hypothetical protein
MASPLLSPPTRRLLPRRNGWRSSDGLAWAQHPGPARATGEAAEAAVLATLTSMKPLLNPLTGKVDWPASDSIDVTHLASDSPFLIEKMGDPITFTFHPQAKTDQDIIDRLERIECLVAQLLLMTDKPAPTPQQAEAFTLFHAINRT